MIDSYVSHKSMNELATSKLGLNYIISAIEPV